ncbi:HlyIII-domain-containing protein [Annulohypoxylon bovei var. microspora]|nr:HlyIII-domain-containing protein [Annulohypoxylon bovei var. microspora]
MASKAKTVRRPGLLAWGEIFPWQRDNDFILTGYRCASYSYSKTLWSIFAVHNETVNIWSHLLGSIFFASVLYQYLKLLTDSKAIVIQDFIVLSVYNLSVTVCFILSTVFHTLCHHSQEICKSSNQLDHLGIVLVLWGAGISGTHFAFYCDEFFRNSYFGLLSSIALSCGIFTLRPEFKKPAYRTARFLIYCFFGASLFVPIVHGLSRFGRVEMGLWSFLGLALINFTGAVVYVARVPERWFPGTFDLLGQSHNWMHVLVVMGALVRLRGLLEVIARWQLHDEQYGFCLSTS